MAGGSTRPHPGGLPTRVVFNAKSTPTALHPLRLKPSEGTLPAMSSSGRATRWVLPAISFLVLSQVHVAAQTRLYVLFGGDAGLDCRPTDCEPGHLMELDIDARALRRDTLVAHARERPSTSLGVTPDGRYLFWTGAESDFSPTYVSVFDVTARMQTTPIRLSNSSSTFRLFAHPSDTKAFLNNFGPVMVATVDGLASMPSVCPYQDLTAVSGDGSRLVVRCAGSTVGTGETKVLDSTSGGLIAVVPEPHYVQATNRAGTEMFIAKWEPGLAPLYRRWDVASGAVLAERRVGVVNDLPDSIDVDPRTGRLWTRLGGVTEVVDPATLGSVGRSPDAAGRVAFDPDSPVAYVVSSTPIHQSSPTHYTTQIRIVDSDSLAVILTAQLPAASRVASISLAPRPPVPSALAATVTARDVALQWSLSRGAPGSTTIVEAGSMPGLTDLASVAVPPGAASLFARGVPSGTYYVRVRTRTAAGLEAISNEVAVAVP
jgi:hypothetical protein